MAQPPTKYPTENGAEMQSADGISGLEPQVNAETYEMSEKIKSIVI